MSNVVRSVYDLKHPWGKCLRIETLRMTASIHYCRTPQKSNFVWIQIIHIFPALEKAWQFVQRLYCFFTFFKRCNFVSGFFPKKKDISDRSQITVCSYCVSFPGILNHCLRRGKGLLFSLKIIFNLPHTLSLSIFWLFSGSETSWLMWSSLPPSEQLTINIFSLCSLFITVWNRS